MSHCTAASLHVLSAGDCRFLLVSAADGTERIELLEGHGHSLEQLVGLMREWARWPHEYARLVLAVGPDEATLKAEDSE